MLLDRRSPLFVMTVVAVGVVTTACSTGGAAAPGAATGSSSVASVAASTELAPAAFAAAVADPGTFVVNVHVPDEGSIAGTDAAIPYDQIVDRAAELPQDRSTPLAIYCRSGRMSAEAAPVLRELGYTDVVELAGGMQAWTSDGRELLPPSR